MENPECIFYCLPLYNLKTLMHASPPDNTLNTQPTHKHSQKKRSKEHPPFLAANSISTHLKLLVPQKVIIMAEEGSEGSVANSSSTSNIWELHGNSLSSWNSHSGFPSWLPSNPNSNSSCEEDISGLSTDDSPHQFMEPRASRGESANDSHLWSKVLL